MEKPSSIELKTLLLKSNEVESVLEVHEVIEAVEAAFREKALGRTQMPPKTYIYYQKYDGDLRVMPGYLEGLDASVVKVVNVHPNNRQHGLPTIMALIVLVEPKTGFPIAVMDGTKITAMRTGAAAAVATKYLARKNSRRLGLVGAGVQSRAQLEALAKVLALREVVIYDRDKRAQESFVVEMQTKYPDVSFREARAEYEAVMGMDVVDTTTPSREPHVLNEWVEYGTHINAIGADAPGKEELDPLILKRGKLVVDDLEQAMHSGEINVPIARKIISARNIHGELGDIVAGRIRGRESDYEITVFDSTGLAIQDAVTADLVYRKASASGLGVAMDIVHSY